MEEVKNLGCLIEGKPYPQLQLKPEPFNYQNLRLTLA